MTSLPTTRVPIRHVIFANAPLLSIAMRRQITKALREEKVAAVSGEQDLAELADEASERVRMAYQDEGYFKVQVEAKASPIDSNGLARWDILVRVLQVSNTASAKSA